MSLTSRCLFNMSSFTLTDFYAYRPLTFTLNVDVYSMPFIFPVKTCLIVFLCPYCGYFFVSLLSFLEPLFGNCLLIIFIYSNASQCNLSLIPQGQLWYTYLHQTLLGKHNR